MKHAFIRAMGAGALAGLCGGFITGGCARAVMGIVALYADAHPHCTAQGTLTLIGCFMAGGLVLGPVFLWLSEIAPGSVYIRGLVFGLLMILALNLPIRLMQNISFEGVSQGEAAVCTILFAALLPVYGLSIGFAAQMIKARLWPNLSAPQAP